MPEVSFDNNTKGPSTSLSADINNNSSKMSKQQTASSSSPKDLKVKTGAKDSVADRIKALQAQAETKDSSKKDNGKKTSSKTKDKSSSDADLKKDAKSPSPLPGGFPDDDLINMKETLSPAKKSAKDKKSKTKSSAKTTTKDQEPLVDLLDLDTRLPTPPPEKETKDRSDKKERPKALRESSSKRDKSKHKDDLLESPPKDKTARPSLSRAKSSRKAGDRDPLDKTSDSDKAARESSHRSRPPVSRGMSFGGMFGLGATPSKSKTVRSSSTTTPKASRRHSVDVGAGLMSPPPDGVDVKDVSPKAAKLMGVKPSVSRRDSKMERRKSKGVPDPYAIDGDDDVVMVDTPNEKAKPAKDERKERDKKPRSKRESAFMSGGLGSGDDAMLVDAPAEGTGAHSGADDPAVADGSRPTLKRSNTSAKKSGGLLSIFGGRKQKESDDFIRSRGYESEDAYARQKKRSAVDDAETSKRLRRENRKVNRSKKETDGDGATDVDADDVEAETERRRAERKARRAERVAAETAEQDQREADRRERHRAAREAKKKDEEEAEEARREERRKKRAERAKRAEEEADAIAAHKAAVKDRPKTDRRKSYAVGDEDLAAHDARREERRLRRSAGQEKLTTDRPRTSRRHSAFVSSAPPVVAAPEVKASKGSDKTSSWVASVSEDPPLPPEIEGTIIDMPLDGAAAVKARRVDEAMDHDVDHDDDGDLTARELRRTKRRSRAVPNEHDEERRRRKEERRAARESEGVKSSSGGSRGEARSRGGDVGAAYNSLGYADMSSGRPPMLGDVGKRTSWFKKMTGF